MVLCLPRQLPIYVRTSLLLPAKESKHQNSPKITARNCITDFSASSSDILLTVRQERDSAHGYATNELQQKEEGGETRKVGVSLSSGWGWKGLWVGREVRSLTENGALTEKCKSSLRLHCQHEAERNKEWLQELSGVQLSR